MGSSSPIFGANIKKYLKPPTSKVLTSYDHFQPDTLVMGRFFEDFLPNYPTQKIQCMEYLPFAISPFNLDIFYPM